MSKQQKRNTVTHAQRLEKLENEVQLLRDSLNTLKAALSAQKIRWWAETEEPKKRGLPRKSTGPSTGLIEVPPSDPPTQETQRGISEQK
jgi:hypothetical protein